MFSSHIVTFHLVGLSPLLTHNPIGMANPKDGRGKTIIPTHEEEAEQGTYRNASGQLCIPTAGFRAGIVSASKSFKKGRSSLKTFVAHIQPTERLAVINDPATTKPVTKYEIDVQRVVIKGSGAILRARPRFDSWMVSISFEFDHTLVTADVLEQILTDAGSRFGVGDFRPERNGWFGRYGIVGSSVSIEAKQDVKTKFPHIFEQMSAVNPLA